MDKDTLEQWKDGVMEHCSNVQQMIRERNLLKKHRGTFIPVLQMERH